MGGVFINYRAVDDPLGAAAIYAILAREFGQDLVFRDCDTMQPGELYPKALRDALERVDVLVVVIGPQWLTLTDGNGVRRIDRDDDWVRREIARAIERKIHLIPVLLKDTPSDARMPKTGEVPESISQLTFRQKLDLSQRRFYSDMSRLTDRIVELVPTLVIPRLFARTDRLDVLNSAPSTLLRPEHLVVPFIGRESELADLHGWATQPAHLAAGLLTGRSGSGKTRLAMELCQRLAAGGWLSGVVSGDAPAAQIQHTARIDQPLLAVVDDLEIRGDQLLALAQAISERATARRAPARLLLLGRSSSDWLSELGSSGNRSSAALLATIGPRSTFQLDAECPDPQRHYPLARTAFARRLGIEDPSGPGPESIDSRGPILHVHARALDAALAGPAAVGHSPSRRPLDRIAYRDRRHWRQQVRSANAAQLRTTDMAVVGTVVTLCRPASAEQAAALRTRLQSFVPDDLESYLTWYERLYPGTHWVSAVGPDPYGDVFVTATLAAEPWIVQTLARAGTETQIRNALTVLGRALPEHRSLFRAITDLLHIDADRLVPLGTEIADRLEAPEPFVRALTAVVENVRLDHDTVLRLMDRVALAPRRHLDPLRAALVAAFPAGLMEILETLQPKPYPAALQPFRKASEMLTQTVIGTMQNLLDPTGKRPPTGQDGRPIVPIPQQLFELYRTYQEWSRRMNDKQPDD